MKSIEFNAPPDFESATVIIPCRNERARIQSCLASLRAQDNAPARYEIIVADGESDDGSREIVEEIARSDPRVRLLSNPGRIVSTGLNAAIRAARGDILLRADVHTRYARDYVRCCIEVLRETGADNVGGPWVAQGEGLKSRAVAAAFPSRFASGGAKSHNSAFSGPVDSVYLGCWRREAFTRFGTFDESLVRNQDDEYNLRIRRGGGTVWQDVRIRSWYMPRARFRDLFNQYRQYGYWKVFVMRKHGGPSSWRHLVPGVFVLLLIPLMIASWASMSAAFFLSLVLGTYVLAGMVASARAAARSSWRLFPILPAIFACLHVAYGVGSLHGAAEVILFRGLRSQVTPTEQGYEGRMLHEVAQREFR